MIKEFMLVVSIVMPDKIPNITYRHAEPTLEACWIDAKDFADRDLTDGMREAGATGYAATCAFREAPSTAN